MVKFYQVQSHSDFYIDKVGISFAVNTNFYKDNNLYFTPSQQEDFHYLDKARNMSAPMLISSHVAYFVEQKPTSTKTYKEILINKFTRKSYHNNLRVCYTLQKLISSGHSQNLLAVSNPTP